MYVIFIRTRDPQLKRGTIEKNKEAICSAKCVRNDAEKRRQVGEDRTKKKRAESISGNIHHCACKAHSELCEGGVHVFLKK